MMNSDVTIKIASFNVGSEFDWYNLYSLTKWKEKTGNTISPTDLKAQKEALYAFEKEDRIKFFMKNPRIADGDIALDTTLNCLEKQSQEIDIILFGLDANSTSKQSSHEKIHRLHPKRMRLFELYGYQMDHTILI